MSLDKNLQVCYSEDSHNFIGSGQKDPDFYHYSHSLHFDAHVKACQCRS